MDTIATHASTAPAVITGVVTPPIDAALAEIGAEIATADVPLTMPGYWTAYRALVSPRLHALVRDLNEREALNARLWSRWSDRAAHLALEGDR